MSRVKLGDAEDVKMYSPVCYRCQHLISGSERLCEAFPTGIPLEIWNGDNLHTSPYPGDHGITFEPRKNNP